MTDEMNDRIFNKVVLAEDQQKEDRHFLVDLWNFCEKCVLSTGGLLSSGIS